MATKRDITSVLEELKGLKNLVEIYAEIASIRMRNIRELVLKNRDFLNSIHDIYLDTLASYARKLQGRGAVVKTPSGKITFLAHNGKTVVVLISANTGFYGSVVQETFREFIKYIRQYDVEVTIVGKLGLSLFLQEEPGHPYTYFGLPDYGNDKAKLSDLIRHLVQYEEIRVFYGQYLSVVKQKPNTYSISAGTEMTQAASKEKKEFLFEPSIENVLEFFETEIFASLFDQTIRESQLAKLASRILAMDTASDNINREIKRTDLTRMRMNHTISDRKQLGALVAAISGK